MKKINYKKKYEQLLSRKEIDSKIINHTRSYIHIPFSWKGIGRFFALLGSIGLAVANFFLIISTWKLLELGDLSESNIKGFYQLLIIYPIVGEYVLIGVSMICLAALIKGGFDKLKSHDELGLIGSLIFCLIVSLIGCLIVSLIGSLIFCLIVSLIGCLIGGLIGSLIFCLIVSLIGCLIIGLIYEWMK